MYRSLFLAASLLTACISRPPPAVPVQTDAGDDDARVDDASTPLRDAADRDTSGTADAGLDAGDIGANGDIGIDADGSTDAAVDAGCAAGEVFRIGCVELVDPSYVIGVTPVETTISDGLIESIATTNAFVQANSVPLVTKSANNTADAPAYFQPDVWLSANGQLTAKRTSTVGNVTVAGTVIEFDPTRVRVQSGAFSTVDTTATVTFDAVDRTASFLVFYYSSTGFGDFKRNSDLAGRFVDDQTVEFYRNGTDGVIEGHWFVVEALSGEFDVQHLPATAFTTAATSISAPEPFAPEASFSIFSHASNLDTDDLALGHLSCTIASGSAIECARNSAAYEIQALHAQIVTLNGTGQTVERGQLTIDPNVTEQRATLSAPALGASAWGGYMGKPGACYTNTTSSIRTAGSFVALSLSDDGTELIARRGFPNDEFGATYDNLTYVLRPFYEVIRW